jgi:thiamine-phosphate pyrophosphorylase
MIPRLYAIADAGILCAHGITCVEFAAELREAGVQLLQYRDKRGSPKQVLHAIAQMQAALQGGACRLIVNDRADLAVLSEADGVHVGQDDLSPADARAVVGAQRMVGVSTHSDSQLAIAALSCADYIAIGPVFSTGSKLNPDPVIGLEGVRRARDLTIKELVAIGGITRDNARSVIEAGADSVAVISGLLVPGESIAKVARDFLDILR